MKKAIVIGSGAGGAMAAKMLANDFDVTVLESGKAFKPLTLPLDTLAMFRKTGLYFDERLIQLFLPAMRIDKAKEMVMVYGRGVGGTTTLATGNASMPSSRNFIASCPSPPTTRADGRPSPSRCSR